MQNWTRDEWGYWVFLMYFNNGTGAPLNIPTATCNHDPKNGSLTIRGTTDFITRDNEGSYLNEIYPSDLNASLDGDSWSLTDPPITITGKTYTDRKTQKSLLDLLGTITLKGTYTVADKPESNIKKGSLTFKASKLDCNRLYRDTNGEGVPTIRITGSATLASKQSKKFDVSDIQLDTLYWGGPSFYSRTEKDADHSYAETVTEDFWLELNVSTTGSKLTGTANVYYLSSSERDDPSLPDFHIYWPDPETPANEFTYSVKGTSKNGIATLNLTGLGVIKGLKATIYIDEDTEEIIQNGKNTITLYGQTIKY